MGLRLDVQVEACREIRQANPVGRQSRGAEAMPVRATKPSMPNCQEKPLRSRSGARTANRHR